MSSNFKEKIWISYELIPSRYFSNIDEVKEFRTISKNKSLVDKEKYYSINNLFELIDFSITYDYGKYIVLLLLKNDEGDLIESKTSLDHFSPFIKSYYRESINHDEFRQRTPLLFSILNIENNDIAFIYNSGKYLSTILKLNNMGNIKNNDFTRKLNIKTSMIK